VDGFSVDPAALAECDLVILATPIEQILAALDSLGGDLSPGTVVTDVGSSKRRICEKAWETLPEGIEFIGGHPVAGREVSGVESSLPNLFQGAPYVLCPASRPTQLERLTSLVESIGANAVVMSPEEHDRELAFVSHMPQLLSTVLANVSGEDPHSVSGSGYRDMTRLAGSPYSVWRGILETNADQIDAALESLIERLQTMRQALERGCLRDEFDRAVEIYGKLRSRKPEA
jgi:prephenate dehydrogenase